LQWSEEILKVMGVPPQSLPAIVPSIDSQTWGHTRPQGPLGAAVPVCGALGDQQAALVGQACFDVGEAKNTYGTGCFLLLNTGTKPVPSFKGLLTTVGYQMRDQKPVYCLEGSIAIAGALVQWLRDNLGLIKTAAEVEDLARTVDDNGGAYIVPAFSGLFAPYWRSDARGAIVGLTRFVNKGHLARAALEANAYQAWDIVEAMNADSGVDLTHLKVDGGMVANELLMQFQADVLDVPVIRPIVTETTALGAAYAAGLAVGYWSGLDDLRKNWAVDKTWHPQMDAQQRQKGLAGWRKAVTRTLDWVE
jgi:glycerol kinase